MKRNGVFIVFVLIFIAVTVWANEPAVSNINGKMEAIGGNVDGKGAQGVQGSVTFPLGHSFGGQIDVLGGKISSEDIFGSGAHLFWRDPDVGLVGATVSQARLESTDLYRYGIEAEYYLDDFTISAYGGNQEGDVESNGYFGGSTAYYVDKNLMIQAGAEGISNPPHSQKN